LFAVVPLFEPAAAEAEDQEADGDDDNHDDPFLCKTLARKMDRQRRGRRTQ
jgi:hypothetical protein